MHIILAGNSVVVYIDNYYIAKEVVDFANKLQVSTDREDTGTTIRILVSTKTQNDAKAFIEMLEAELGCTCEDCW